MCVDVLVVKNVSETKFGVTAYIIRRCNRNGFLIFITKRPTNGLCECTRKPHSFRPLPEQIIIINVI